MPFRAVARFTWGAGSAEASFIERRPLQSTAREGPRPRALDAKEWRVAVLGEDGYVVGSGERRVAGLTAQSQGDSLKRS
jgi:hypothetical protein